MVRGRWIALGILLALAGLELGVRVLYQPPGRLMPRLEEFTERGESAVPDVVILGTCMGADVTGESVQRGAGGTIRAFNMSVYGAFALDWYLIAANHLLVAGDVGAIVVLYGPYDLARPQSVTPWESHVMDVAKWRDVPLILGGSGSPHGDLVGFMASRLLHSYRYRGYLANWFWHRLGAGKPRGADEVVAPMGMSDLALRPPDGIMSIRQESGLYYLNKLMELAAEKGIRIVFVPLPIRPGTEAAQEPGANPAYMARVRRNIRKHGAEVLDLRDEAGLGVEHFMDALHMNSVGGRAFGAVLGRALARGPD